jgi:hypothetical protein
LEDAVARKLVEVPPSVAAPKCKKAGLAIAQGKNEKKEGRGEQKRKRRAEEGRGEQKKANAKQ